MYFSRGHKICGLFNILIFKNGELELEVTVSEDREDVWLSQDQMATLLM